MVSPVDMDLPSILRSIIGWNSAMSACSYTRKPCRNVFQIFDRSSVENNSDIDSDNDLGYCLLTIALLVGISRRNTVTSCTHSQACHQGMPVRCQRQSLPCVPLLLRI